MEATRARLEYRALNVFSRLNGISMKIDKFITSKLLGKIWHVTSHERYQLIMSDGFIRSEPAIGNDQRWSTRQGPRWYPFVRHIGGFSLFDFPVGFDLDRYRQRCPSSSLEALIPYRPEWGHSVWLEIDQVVQATSLLRGDVVWERCEKEGRGRRCMPHIEAAHIGDMPTSSIAAANLFAKGDTDWRAV